MGFEELVDTLIADGHKTVSLVSKKRLIDDDEETFKEYLILDQNGDIVAKKICVPESYGWSMVYWSASQSGTYFEVEIGEIDLTDGATAKGYFFLFGCD
ncbi:hypothetical protein JEM67_00395 (plasmid) [Serratia sp. PAMC26656]|uniref:hypothetical protein n=1 Tax=Serratia sp. PAMC26656 TaxID=2775909 RepID=UPI0018F76EF8|nr:hypothetical protein [Serratia sp. PAMC26656]MBJ7889456.1 hypothetical protein [Serratia sp. PAMC26656]